MKRSLTQLFILSLIIIMGAALFTGCSQADAVVENNPDQGDTKRVSMNLSLAHFFPATHPAETLLVQQWAALIDEVTDGQITITSYPGQTLLAAPEIYDGVQSGVADIGLSCFSYTRGRFPLLEAFELPGIVYNNSKVASKVAWEGLKELDPVEVKDTRLMMVLATGPGDLFTKMPVRTLEDLQGLEIRATGLSAKTLEAMGATPVAMPQSDAYEALSRGVVQGNLSPIEVLQGWRHAEVTDYLTMTPFLYNTLFFVTMNLDVWNSIPDHLQETITVATEEFFNEVAIGLWDEQNDSALEFAVNETNQEIIHLSEEETSRWMEMVMPIQDEFIAEMDALGLDGRAALEIVQRHADKYNAVYK